MKVTYRKDILEKINDAIIAAERDNKVIEQIELNETESQELRRESSRYAHYPIRGVLRDRFGKQQPTVVYYNGVKIILPPANTDF